MKAARATVDKPKVECYIGCVEFACGEIDALLSNVHTVRRWVGYHRGATYCP
jgi:hypothetical protein